ncbi:flagellar motor switch protein FliG [Spirochaetia bacterium]|nr:flagellar motor switch protein FliG [Spirochaetia bacterium]
MGKFKLPGHGNYGLAAYQKALKNKDTVEPDDDSLPAQDSGIESAPRGLLKTRPKKPAAEPKTAQLVAPAAPLEKTVPSNDTGPDSKYRRVAKFLILIGAEDAARILSALDSDQVEAISKEITTIRGITEEEGAAILEEFKSLLASSYGYMGAASGGVDAARRLLYSAFGPEKGESLLIKAVPDAAENPFDFLKDFSGDQIAILLREELPAATAMILARLPPKLAAAALAAAPAERKLDIFKRIAHQGQVAPEVLERVSVALKEKARHISRGGDDASALVDGMNALTAILKHSDVSFGDQILGELADEDPELSRNLKERLHTLEDVVKAADKPIQEKLRTMTDQEIALLLKGRSVEFTAKIYANLSAGRQIQVREEAELLGPVLKRDVDKAAHDFLAWFRLNREEGRIMLLDDDDVIL